MRRSHKAIESPKKSRDVNITMKLVLYSLCMCFFPIPTAEGAWISSKPYWTDGDDVVCQDGEVMVGACSSGQDRDCARDEDNKVSSHTIRCESLEGDWFETVSLVYHHMHCVLLLHACSQELLFQSFEGAIAGKTETDIVVAENWADTADCPASGIAKGLCSSGGSRCCINKTNNREVKTTLYCDGFSSSISTAKESSQCGSKGVRLLCPKGQAITNICTSGQDDDCRAKLGCTKSGSFTAITCSELQFTPSTRSPSSSPTTKIATEPPHLPTCIEESERILEATDPFYNDKDATQTVLTIGGRITEFFDFTTNQAHNAVYKNACETEENGKYMELTYKMTCVSDNEDQDEVDLFVIKHPRCFSSICADTDQDALLQEFVVQTTEDRNNDSKECTWSCTDAEITDDVPSGCKFESDVLNNADDIIFARNDGLNPTVEPRKVLGVTVSDSWNTAFPSADVTVYRAVCAEEGGNVTIVSTIITCKAPEKEKKQKKKAEGTRRLEDEDKIIFHVQNYPTCLGTTCGISSSATRDLAIVGNFKNTMVDQGHLKDKLECRMTGESSFGYVEEESFLQKYGLWLGICGGVILLGGGAFLFCKQTAAK